MLPLVFQRCLILIVMLFCFGECVMVESELRCFRLFLFGDNLIDSPCEPMMPNIIQMEFLCA